MSAEMKECYRCHRVGWVSFVPSGDYGYQCQVEASCNRRVRERSQPDASYASVTETATSAPSGETS